MDNEPTLHKSMQLSGRAYLITGLMVAVFLWLLSPILTPFFLGGLIAYLGHPVVDRLQSRGLSRVVGVLVVFLLVMLMVLGLMLMVLPQFIAELGILLQKVPLMLDWAGDQLVSRWSGSFGDAVGASVNVQTLSGLVTDWGQVQSLLMTGLRELFSSGAAVLSTLATLALTPVVAFYWLRDWPLMVTQLQRFVPPTSSAKVQVLATECDSVLSGFFRGQLMVMIALAVIYSVGLSLLGLKGSLAIGVVAGLFSVVPYLGTVIGLLIGVLAALYQFQDVLHPSLVLAVFLVGQLSEGMLLTPWLVGDRIGLHPVAVIFALMAGGQLFGFVGILIALPVVAVLVVAVRHLLLDRLTFEPRPGVENESSATSSDAASDGVVQAPNPRPED